MMIRRAARAPAIHSTLARLGSVLLLAISTSACSDDPAVSSAPLPSATLEVGPFSVKSGEDLSMCTFVRSDNDEPEDVVVFETTLDKKVGHHIMAYLVDHDVDLGTIPCAQGGQPGWTQILVSQISQERREFPEGIGFRIQAHQQFAIETHFINVYDETLDVKASVAMTFAAEGSVTVPAATYYFGTGNIDIAPNSASSSSVSCKVPAEINLHTMIGHVHNYGTGVRVNLAHGETGAPELLYETKDWQAPPIKTFDGGLALGPTDTVSVFCDWDNTSPNRLRYPLEMCYALGYYWPSRGTMTCSSGGKTDDCSCYFVNKLDSGPGGAQVDVTLRRNDTIPGAGGEIDTGAPIYCMLWHPEDLDGLSPKEGKIPYNFRLLVDQPLKSTSDQVSFSFYDVTPRDYVISCMMDTIGGGFIAGSGDVVNSVVTPVTASTDHAAHADVLFDLAIP